MQNKNCDLCKNGKCAKMIGCRHGMCEVSDRSWLNELNEDDALFIQPNEICRRASIFGNEYIGLTIDDINRMLHGDVIHIYGEYGIFIGLSEKEYVKHESNME